MKTLVIGYGSTLRCDDGVGQVIAEKLIDEIESQKSDPGSQISDRKSQVESIARQLLTPDLADTISRADKVIFIDACAESAPGEIKVRDVMPEGANWGAFVHEMSPEVLLDCVMDIYHVVPRAQLITIGGESFEIGEGLTEKVTAAIPKVIEMVMAGIRPVT